MSIHPVCAVSLSDWTLLTPLNSNPCLPYTCPLVPLQQPPVLGLGAGAGGLLSMLSRWARVVVHPCASICPVRGCGSFAGMSLYSGFWNTYGVCAGGFEGEKRGGGGWRAYILTAPYRSPAAGRLGGQHRLRRSRRFGPGDGDGAGGGVGLGRAVGLGCRVLGMVGEGCYHHKQCCGDAAWASRPEEGVGVGWSVADRRHRGLAGPSSLPPDLQHPFPSRSPSAA